MIDQPTICRWKGCKSGDLGSHKELCAHVNNQHISMSEPLSGKPKVGRYRYRCLWSDCHHLALHTGQLKTHVRYYHTNERQYFCRHCDYRGVTKGDLLGHVRRRHGQDIVPQYLQSAGKRNQRVDGVIPATTRKKVILMILTMRIVTKRLVMSMMMMMIVMMVRIVKMIERNE